MANDGHIKFDFFGYVLFGKFERHFNLEIMFSWPFKIDHDKFHPCKRVFTAAFAAFRGASGCSCDKSPHQEKESCNIFKCAHSAVPVENTAVILPSPTS